MFRTMRSQPRYRPFGQGETFDSQPDRRSPAYARWIQQSLNQILGTRLAVDGIIGPQTRSATRSFQSQRGLTADGIVGPITERAMLAAGAPSPPGAAPLIPVIPPGVPVTPPVAPRPPVPVPQVTPRDSAGRSLLTGGVWSGNASLAVQGGQGMNFVIKNVNVLGTTITIRDHFGQSQSRIIPPLAETQLLFTAFGCEPMSWRFSISTNSDAFIVGWSLFSTWIPGDPPNC